MPTYYSSMVHSLPHTKRKNIIMYRGNGEDDDSRILTTI